MKYFKLSRKESEILQYYGFKNTINEKCSLAVFSEAEEVIREETIVKNCYIITKGRAKAYKTSEDGKRIIIGYFGSGDMLGEVELLTAQEAATTTVCAISKLECISVDYDLCRKELNENIVFSNKIGYILAQRLVKSTDNYALSSLYSYSQRLCDYILKNSNFGYFRDLLTETSLSLGISYRHMLRILNTLCKNNVLEKNEKGYKILDEDLLKQYREKGIS